MKLGQVLLLLLALNIQPVVGQAAPAKLNSAENKSLLELKKKSEAQLKEVEQLGKDVNNIEITLGLNNKKYLKLAEDRASIEERLTAAKKNASYDNESLEKKYNDSKKVLMGVLLNKLENTENPADILARKILVTQLKKEISELESLMSSNKNAQNELELMYSKLEESMSVERELLTVMGELEEKKVALKAELEEKTKASEAARMNLDTAKNKAAMNKKARQMEKARGELASMQTTEEIKVANITNPKSDGFIPPIAQYLGMDYQKKGVTFSFSGVNNIRATKDGKIIYTGTLANYGNVLMIDHGNDTRSVMLGQFDYLVKKGDSVTARQVVAKTSAKATGALSDGKLYFEVRKNNLAQNTYLLLDKNALAKNSN